MEPVPEYTPDELLEKTRSLGFPKYLQDFFEKCIDFHTYPAPGVLIGVFMVDYALATLGNSPRDKIFVTCETQKCLPDPPQVIMHATIGNHRLRVLPIGKFAITLTPSSADENVKVCESRSTGKDEPATPSSLPGTTTVPNSGLRS